MSDEKTIVSQAAEPTQPLDPSPHADQTIASPEKPANLTRPSLVSSPTAITRIGKYEVKAVLGKGGMGVVYRAYQATLERDVAIKLIHTSMAKDLKFITLFQSEAKVVATLRHPGIVQVYDFDVADNAFYMVMEFIPGQSLQRHLLDIHARHERMLLDKALPLFHAITAAVAYAHDHGVVHQDIKPANVLLTEQEKPILLDFGLSKIMSGQKRSLADTGSGSGTPAYMSPEQGMGKKTDARTDVYALGVMLYQLTTGQLPFQADTPISFINKHIHEPLPPPRSKNPDLPQVVEHVIQKALAKDPAERYPSARALLLALEENVWPQMGFAPVLETVSTITKAFTGHNPYRGLRKFTAHEAEFFFGRDEAIRDLLNIVRHVQTNLDSPNLMAVLGPSGSGKSSLVRAGLIPALGSDRIEGSQRWPLKVMLPGPKPLDALAQVFVDLTGRDLATIRTDLDSGPKALRRLITEALRHDDEDTVFVLLIDQFEEIFTLSQDKAEQRAFLEQLLYVAQHKQKRALLILTMRADFYARVAAYKPLAQAITHNQMLVSPLTEPELRQAILLPAEAVGLRLEKALVEALLKDTVGAAGVLPLLQYTLLELFGQRDGHILTLRAYHQIGGVEGALAHRADSVLLGLTTAQQQIARRIFLRLVRPGEGEVDTRRRAVFEEVLTKTSRADEIQTVVQTLANANLIITNRQVETEQVVLDVVHEALIRAWPTLRQWLDDDRQSLRIRQQLSRAARDWQERGRDEDSLYRGGRLLEVEEWVAANPDEINLLEQELLETSISARDREQTAKEAQRQRELEAAHQLAAEQQHRAEVVRRALILVAALLLLALGAAGFAFIKQREAEQQARLAFSRQLAIQSVTELKSPNYELALLLALEARHQADTSEAFEALRQALAHPGRTSVILFGHTRDVKRAVWNSAETRILTPSSDGTVRVWNAATGAELLTLSGHDDTVYQAVWNGDETRILTASFDGTARVWDAASGAELLTLSGHNDTVYQATWNRAETRILTAAFDGTARVWDAASGAELLTLTGHTDGVWQAIWNDAETRILTTSGDYTARIWDAVTGTEQLTLAAHTDIVYQAIWNSAETRILTASADGDARLWDVSTGQELLTLSGHNLGIRQAIWNDAETRILTASDDGTARVWDAASGAELLALTGHTLGVWQAVWNSDESRILTAGRDKTARVWNAETGTELFTLAGHRADVRQATWNDAETRILTASEDSTARVWDVAIGTEQLIFAGHTNRVRQVVWNAAENRIMTAGADGTARVWNAETGTELLTLSGHTLGLWQATWNDAESRILTASDDGTAKVWDAATGAELLTLSGHTLGVWQAVWNAAETLILTTSGDGTARIWDATTGAELLTFTGHTSWVRPATWNAAETRLLTTSGDGTTRVWDAATGDVLLTLTGHALGVWQATWSPAENRILTASFDDTARVWDAATGDELLTLSGHTNRVMQAVWNRDGTRILTASRDDTARVWDAATGDELFTLTGHTDNVNQAAWNAAENRILTTSSDGTARIWDAAGVELMAFSGHTDVVYQAVWSADESRILTASADGTARLYEVQDEDLLALTCQLAPRNISWSEWQRFMGAEPYRRTCSNLPLHPSFIETGRQLARVGRIEDALAQFRQALIIDPHLKLDPETEAATGLIAYGEILLKQGDIEKAAAAIKKAQSLAPDLEIYPVAWNTFCWQGTLRGHAAEVLAACEQAVTLDPSNGNTYDSRGLARALTGDVTGAIEDFTTAIEQWSQDGQQEDLILQRQTWLTELKAGHNPFDPDTLEALKQE